MINEFLLALTFVFGFTGLIVLIIEGIKFLKLVKERDGYYLFKIGRFKI